MSLIAVSVPLTRLSLLFLGLTWNASADEIFHAHDPHFGTHFRYIFEHNVILDFRKDLKTFLFKEAFY